MPSPTGVTTPLSTVATFALLEAQLKVACAVAGTRLGVRVRVSPMLSLTVPVLSSVTAVGW